MMKYTTIKDIAKELDISKSTVSRALSGDSNVSKETREKVVALANKMGYKRNDIAANLRMQQSKTVGIIVPEMVTPFFMYVIMSAQKVLDEQGFKVIITQSHEDPQAESYNLKLMENYRVDGIIMSVCHSDINLKEYFRLQEEGIPIVFFDRVPSKIHACKVIVNDYVKSMLMMEHLIRSGRKRILHLAGPARIPNTEERKKAYKDSLAKFKIPFDPELLIEGENERSEGERVIRDFLRKKIPFDAIFSFGETLSIGALSYIQSQGIKVPEEIAICGFSGTYLSTIVTPQLTAIQQPFEKMGRVSAEQIIKKINDPESSCETIILDAEIVIRQST
ncbi:LacI family DNA-binding transcriptional regulator [Dysgonomonas sp. ZJ709]|uniref:LacI family DNA-binding transcriptional regulator n=1 Tax=Dysgonomonas sp. ZJ709 TaxID=2709797 RepID=UPI00351A8BE9